MPEPTAGLVVKNLRPGELRPYQKNARKHSEEQVRQIATSIEKFGWRIPILIDEQKRIICGHARHQAAILLELEEIPCVEASDMSEAQKRAFTIADNKLALNAEWDNDILKEELLTLEKEGVELVETGFNEGELEFILDRVPVDPNATSLEDDKPAVCRKGDIWRLGDHRLHVGANGLKFADQAIQSWQGASDEEARLDNPEGYTDEELAGDDARPTFKTMRKVRKLRT